MHRIIVTGGAGFIGSALVRYLVGEVGVEVLNVDKLTYAGNLESLEPVSDSPGYRFERADIGDAPRMRQILTKFRPDAIINLAAESHVDRSIDGPDVFVQSNVLGTYTLLKEAWRHWRALDTKAGERFRFLHVSTDEVFGSLGAEGYFTEESAYRPNSPYAATKAASDHLVRAWHHTYGLPVITTNCSNNYGPYQFPEKLIPLMIINALGGERLGVYGKGENVRDWLYVDDHARALWRAVTAGRPGETYAVGGHNERTNLQVVEALCEVLDRARPDSAHRPHRQLIELVTDRPGHDLRYAIDASKIERELGWTPRETFESGLAKTVAWYLENTGWWQRVRDGSYRGERLGLGDLA